MLAIQNQCSLLNTSILISFLFPVEQPQERLQHQNQTSCNFQFEVTLPPVVWSSLEPIPCMLRELCLLKTKITSKHGMSVQKGTAKMWQLNFTLMLFVL